MRAISSTAALIAAALTISSGAAVAAKPVACKIPGTWTDTLGAKAVIVGKKGTLTVPTLICSSTYAVAVKVVKGGADFTATNSSCPTLTATLAYETGTCNVATGTDVVDGVKIADTWTRAAAASHAPAFSTLTDGLK